MRVLSFAFSLAPILALLACSDDQGSAAENTLGSGGDLAAATGGASGGVSAVGGTPSGGAPSGGAPSGGAAPGGSGASAPTGGASASGGAPSDGGNTGDGGTTGEVGTGGTENTGGAGTGGMPDSGYDADCTREETEKHKGIVRDGMTAVLVNGMGDRIDEYWADPYIQHNPFAQSGLATFKMFFGEASAGTYALTRLIGECDKVLIHGSYGNGAMFDMLRVDPEKERMVEHWDCASGSLDGPTEVTDVELTGANRAVAIGFVTEVMINGNRDTADSYLAPDLIEHAAGGTDGADAFMQRVSGITYSTIHHQIADGNFVFTMSEGSEGASSNGYYDLFRLEGGMIVEHWGGSLAVQAGASGEGIF